MRLVSGFEALLDPLVAALDNLPEHFDPVYAPRDVLDLLTEWLGLEHDEARSGEERRTLSGHTDWVYGCAISPSGDYVVSVSDDQTLKVWDARTGEERRTLRGHTHWVTSVAFAADGQVLASASGDDTVKLWDALTWKLRATLTGHAGGAYSVSVSPDGKTLAAGCGNGDVKLWNLATLREAMEALFAKYGPCAIAVKSQHAYRRTLAWQERTDAGAEVEVPPTRARRPALAGVRPPTAAGPGRRQPSRGPVGSRAGRGSR